MTATLDALWLAVEQSPDDWQRYEVLADALNDAGEERLERAVRWMAREGKRPAREGKRPDRAIAWWWHCESERAWCGFMEYSCLPRGFVRYGAKGFDDLSAAVSWLADQLERVGA